MRREDRIIMKLVLFFRFAGVLFCGAFLAISGFAQKYPCLPSDVKEDSVVSVVTSVSPRGGQTTRQITVSQTLKKLKAKCYRGKLVDGRRKEIRFYYLQGCWGNPPADYLEILDAQAKEIAKLKRRYTVIEMTCNPEGTPPRLIS
jgi:hypothetical protein